MNMQSSPPVFAVQTFYTESAIIAIALFLVIMVATALVRPHRPAIDWPAEPRRWRRSLRIGLGILWVVDGLLQAQPSMVTRFIGGLLAPLVAGQPAWLGSLMLVGVRIWGVAPIQANVFACLIQLAIGITLLVAGESIATRFALWASVGWGALIWVFGEGFGGIFVGGNWLSGAPGSVFIYMAAAWLLLIPDRAWEHLRLHVVFGRGMAAILWLGAFLQAWPAAGGWDGADAAYVRAMAVMPQPRIVSLPVHAWANLLHADPVFWNALFVVGLSGLGLVWLIRPRSKLVWWASLVWVGLTWWLAQDWGVFGGMSTDPNMGAVLIAVLLAYGADIGVWPGSLPRNRHVIVQDIA